MKTELPQTYRILQVSAYAMDRFGGVQSHIRSLADGLRSAGHDVKTVSPGSSASDDKSIFLGRARTIAIAGTKFEVSFVGRDEIENFQADMKQWQPDIIHVHGLWVPFLPWQITRAVKAARVVTFHDTPPPGLSGSLLRSVFSVLSGFILNTFDAAISVSDLPLRHLKPGPRGIRPVVVPPMIDLHPFQNITKPPLEKLNTVFFWGRFEDRKGVDVLLRAIEMIDAGQVAMPASLSELRFVLAGKGASTAAKSLKAKAGSRVRIDFFETLPQEMLMKRLEEARLVVLPSLYGESFGIVIIEAMASGTPIVVADNPGYRAALQGQFDSCLIPVGNAAALAQKIIDCFNDEAGQRTQAEAARNYAKRFDLPSNIDIFLDVYRDALDRSSRSKAP